MALAQERTFDPDGCGGPGRGPLIRSAGGLVWREDAAGGQLVCLVHRPRYDDWSLPKGKLSAGEHPLAAAVREVAEEARVAAVPQLPLRPARYLADGLAKRVDYWAMTPWPATGSGCPAVEVPPDTSEVDQVAWLAPAEAIDRVTHPRDAQLLRQWLAAPPITGIVLLVRHADAGTRDAWRGEDTDRPLSGAGIVDAARLCRLLRLHAPSRLVSASPQRCQRTLTPLSARCGLPIEVDPVFDEATGDTTGAAAALPRLAIAGGTTVVCSQGQVIPPVLTRLAGLCRPGGATAPGHWPPPVDEAGRSGDDWRTAKGDGWLLPFSGPLPLAIASLRIDDAGQR